MTSLLDTPVGWLVEDKRELVVVNENDSAENVLQTMQRHNVLAIPVQAADGSFVGVITMLDLMTLVAFGSFKVDEEPSSYQMFTSLSARAGDICSSQLHAEDQTVWSTTVEAPVKSVLEAMCKGVHRFLVKGESQEGEAAYRLLSQTDVLRSFSCNPDDAALNALDKTVGEAVQLKTPLTVKSSDTALRAFRALHQNSVSAAPVVNEDGVLVANISSSDLRNLSAGTLKLVLEPVLTFLGDAKAMGLKTSVPRARSPVSTTSECTLRSLINTMLIQRVHRVWVVDDARKPIGVVSMTDVVRAVYNENM
jgi:5'-AMP-activated protein kinase, regulatory gamma subunit